jgi:Glycosyl hydrolases family 43
MRLTFHRAAIAGLAALAVTGTCATAATAYRQPNAPFKVGDPGVLFAHGRWIDLATGSWSQPGTISTAQQAKGPWTLANKNLLTRRPQWAAVNDHSVWAPSLIKIGGKYVVFYAAVIKGEGPRRCIGTGISDQPSGPFEPRDQPISCIAGHGAPDSEPGVAAGNSTIDATPSYATVNGKRRLYLTYKTQHTKPDGHYYTTIRMVRLNASSAATGIVGRSHRLTTRPDNIEENPVLVQRGDTFTLFTSLGGYTLCTYHTEWRQSKDLWHWPQASRRLSFPAATNTCGTGDAAIASGVPQDSWRIFFSGRYPNPGDSFKLYVGKLTWPGGKPRVTAML